MIGFIAWWFFVKHEAKTETAAIASDQQDVDILVKGGYSPEQVVLKQGVPAKLHLRGLIHLAVWIMLFSLILGSIKHYHKIKKRRSRLIQINQVNMNGLVGWICSTAKSSLNKFYIQEVKTNE